MNVETKSVFQSLTFWSLVVAIAARLLSRYGFEINDALRADTAQTILDIVTYVVGPIGVMIGRWRAAKPLSVSGGVKPTIIALPVAIFIVLSSAGCLGTSSSYKQAAFEAGTRVIAVTDPYIARDPDPVHAADAKKQSDALAIVIANPKTITVGNFTPPWDELTPTYLTYVSADPRFADRPLLLEDRKAIVEKMNRITERELQRQNKWRFFNNMFHTN